MPAITIRNVPESTRNELAARAAASGRSLQEYLCTHLIELAAKPDVAVVMAAVARRLGSDGPVLTEQAILNERDTDRA